MALVLDLNLKLKKRMQSEHRGKFSVSYLLLYLIFKSKPTKQKIFMAEFVNICFKSIYGFIFSVKFDSNLTSQPALEAAVQPLAVQTDVLICPWGSPVPVIKRKSQQITQLRKTPLTSFDNEHLKPSLTGQANSRREPATSVLSV